MAPSEKSAGAPSPPYSPIAICGMGMRLPGNISNAADLWEFIISASDARTEIPQTRWDAKSFHGHGNSVGTTMSQYGYFLEDRDLGCFDKDAFPSVSRKEAEQLDPAQRILMEVVQECFENAGETNWQGRNIGCYVGSFADDYADLHAKDPLYTGFYRLTGTLDFAVANRISYQYDLRGPSVTVRTACSASLTALHQACGALHRGEIDAALVCGVNLITSPTMSIALNEQGVLSPDGSCRTFDAAANGYARGEAVTAIVIKRLDDALDQGNPIRAVIRGTSLNFDGKGSSLGQPNPVAQEALIRQAYKSAGLDDFAKTAFVECHGTGTHTGDPLEVIAVGNVFGDAGVYIGSVKPNLGHAEGASGLTSLIKSVLSLEHRIVPPNIKFDNPNPQIDFKSGRLKVPTEPIPWPHDREARISINSFGFGGSNAHVIMDSAESFCSAGRLSRPALNGIYQSTSQDPDPQLLVFSASHEASLRRSVENYGQYILKNPSSLADLAYTLGSRREHLMHRAFCITDGKHPPEVSRLAKVSRDNPQLVFVFTGQGAQWPRMGAELLNDFPVVRESFAKMEYTLANLPSPCPWSLREELLKPAKDSLVPNATYSQPLCTALQCALVDLLRSFGICPQAVVGHSSGEIAAAYASGALSLHDAIIVAYQRGMCSSKIKKSGAMAALGLGRKEVERFLRPGVGLACENSPESTTISGDAETVDLVMATIKSARPETFVRRLQVDKAYHSHHVGEIAQEYWDTIRDIKPRDPVIPFFSSLYETQILDGRDLGPTYWRLNGESPVLFNSAVTAIIKSNPQPKVFLEIGPHAALSGPLRQIMKAMQLPFQYTPTLQRNSHGTRNFLDGVGNLYLRGMNVDFAKLHHGRKVLSDLPTYPWNYSTNTFWSEPRMSKEWRLPKYPRHDLLGSRVTATNELEPSWRNILSTDNVPWIRDHVVQSNIVFPFAGYVAIAAAAVQQVAETEGPIAFRHIVVRQALVMYEGKCEELSTTFRHLRLTDKLYSDWWEFNIASHTGDGGAGTWISHCTGEVRVLDSTGSRSSPDAALPRSVDPSYWYKIIARTGLGYGPEFKGLDRISTDPTSNKARCSVAYIERQQAPSYQIHPCELDKCFQSIFLAMSRGLGRRFTRAMVPTTIEEVILSKQNSTLRLETTAEVEAGRGDVVGNITGSDEGNVVLQVKGLRASVLEGLADQKEDSHSGGRVKWMPDIRFLDLVELIQPPLDRRNLIIQVEKLNLLYIIDLTERLRQQNCPAGYLGKHFKWLLNQHQAIRNGGSAVVQDCQSLIEMSEEARRNSITTLRKTLCITEARAPAAAVSRAFEIVEDVFSNKAGAVEGLFRDDTLANLYRFMDFRYCKDFFRCLAHNKPAMRILEIGAGTGGATQVVMENLLSSNGERMYNSYTFTDVSAGFFAAAKDKLQKYPGIKYQVLDISQDPLDQGFTEGDYDLVIAANVLHATPNLKKTLEHARKLMKPDGYLFLQELSIQATFLNSIMGLLEGWWLGEEDGRDEQPHVDVERWKHELQNAGFRGVEIAAHDSEQPYQINVCLVSRPAVSITSSKLVTLLSNEFGSTWKATAEVFTRHGYQVQSCRLGELIPSSDAVVSILDLEEPFFYNMSPSRLNSLQTFLKQCEWANIIWATNASQIDCEDPRYAMSIGAIRTLRGELALPITTVELENTCPQALQSLFEVLEVQQRHIIPSDTTAGLEPDFEFSFSKGLVMIPRILPVSVADGILGDGFLEQKRNERMELQAGNGSIDTIRWVATRPKYCGELDVEVEVKCVGLNFKDMLLAMFIVRDAKSEMGLEGAGIVRNVGPKVTRVKPGDRIMFYSGGAFTSRCVMSEDLCIKIPERLTFEEAATMPCVFVTTIHSLLDLGGLRKRQTVLIHSACGAVGLAALQLCRMAGADIFATVGSDEKVQYLETTFGIAPDRIFNSRDASFLEKVLHATNGRGVDLILNSLSGELLHASWKCLAKFGRMVEIGKRDFQGNAKLQMSLFEGNRSFFGVDIHETAAEAPHVIARLLGKTISLYEQGLIQPITPVTLFEASAVQTAFRHIQQGKHIGKIIVCMPTTEKGEDAPPIARKPREVKFDAHFAYFLVGGMGGLGRSVSSWLVECGARHLIFLSRSAGKSETDQAFAKELNSQGCKVQVFSGSITSQRDVSSAVKGATAPIKGVINLSMVLQDRPFLDMTYEDWEIAVLPKVQGTYILHEALKDSPLDWFVMFSSFSGIIGQWNQSNYAAANTFLDAFVQYRHCLGLPASVMDVGVVEDHGYMSRSAELTANFKNWGAQMVQEQDLLDALQLSMELSNPCKPLPAENTSKSSFLESVEYVERSQLILGLKTSKALSDPATRVRWRRDRRMSIYHNDNYSDVQSESRADYAELRALFKNASEDATILTDSQSVQTLTRAIGLKICDLMLLAPEDLDTSASLADIGVDSLIVMEIRSWWKSTFRFAVSTLEFLSCTSINEVGQLAANGLLKLNSAKGE